MLYENKPDYYSMVEERNSLQFPLHIHHYIEVVRVVNGALDMQIGAKIYHLSAGDIAFIFPNIAHDYRTQSDDRHTLLQIGNCHLHLLPLYKIKLEKNYPKTPVLRGDEHPPQLDWFFEQALQIKLSSENDELAGSLYSVAIGYALPYLNIVPIDHNLSKELTLRIISYISDHSLEDLSLDEVAHHFGISKYTLSRIFSGVLGTNFSSYINVHRIKYATYQLLNTEKDITTIAYECGYHNQQTFNRVFKQEYGMTPSEYRSKHTGLLYPWNQGNLLPKSQQPETPMKP